MGQPQSKPATSKGYQVGELPAGSFHDLAGNPINSLYSTNGRVSKPIFEANRSVLQTDAPYRDPNDILGNIDDDYLHPFFAGIFGEDNMGNVKPPQLPNFDDLKGILILGGVVVALVLVKDLTK
jgi:hypothetical protein